MSNKKYEININQEDNSWTAVINRKVSARKTTITKSQAGFTSQDEASSWADIELAALLKVQAERNQRRTK